MSIENTIKAYSIKTFCEAYSIGRTKAYEEIKNKRLEITKVGKRTLITAENAEKWLNRLDGKEN